MKNKKNIFFLLLIFLSSVAGIVNAEESIIIEEVTPEPITINLTLRSGATVIFEDTVELAEPGTRELDGHPLNNHSVLAVINDADVLSPDFEITEIQYFDSFGSFYLKCIESSVGNDCDNWQYLVNDLYSSIGMDQNILSGGEDIYVYFGPQNKITLSSNNITIADTLTVTAQKYDYQNDAWVTRTEVTAGLTQPNPSTPFSPTEIKTETVDTNGQAIFSSIPSGSYEVGIKEDFYFPVEQLTVSEITPSSGSSGSNPSSRSHSEKPEGNVLGAETKISFNLEKAFDFLITQQKENGSFGENLYTDWVALALASGNHQNQAIKLIKYLGEIEVNDWLLTDYERHAMSLMALGLNPYNTNGQNYIEKIIASFDGKQFGDINEDNDDIFALIVLQNSGFALDEKIIIDDLAFILNKQKLNGSWDESVDMTGAAIEALSAFNKDEKVKNALQKAREFLKQNQKDNGGWGNAPSTAWALEGITALGETPEDWRKKDPSKEDVNNTPFDFLATIQDIDGGVKNENIQNKIWETAYVVSALSGKTWNQTMQKFEKPKIVSNVVTPKKTVKKQKLTTMVTTTTTNAVPPSPVAVKDETPKRNWFARFLDKIFNVF